MGTNQKTPAEINFRADIIEEHKPWGKFRRYPHKDVNSIKIITVDPGQTLSLQVHALRAEFWIILDQGLEITSAEKIWTAQPGEEIFIPEKTPHRARNLGHTPARIMEIWLGSSNEEDIIRLKDEYGREGP